MTMNKSDSENFKSFVDMETPGVYMSVSRERFLYYMGVKGFTGYVREGKFWINYKFLKEHAAGD